MRKIHKFPLIYVLNTRVSKLIFDLTHLYQRSDIFCLHINRTTTRAPLRNPKSRNKAYAPQPKCVTGHMNEKANSDSDSDISKKFSDKIKPSRLIAQDGN